MNTILTITQQDIEPEFVPKEGVVFKERRAARAVLFDKNGRVALLHAARLGYHKLPGGGVEEGEDIALALARELQEEVGAEATVLSEIGEVEEWRVDAAGGLHQLSEAFVAEVSGSIGEPEFTEKELADGFSVVWAQDIDDAISRVSETLDHEDSGVRFMTLRDKAILEAVAMDKGKALESK